MYCFVILYKVIVQYSLKTFKVVVLPISTLLILIDPSVFQLSPLNFAKNYNAFILLTTAENFPVGTLKLLVLPLSIVDRSLY